MRISDGSSDVCSSDLPFGELRDALDLVGDGAELFVECDVREFFGVLGQRLLLILFPEEARVGQARGEDLAAAGDDLCTAVARDDIRGADESVGDLSVGAVPDEIFLFTPPRGLVNTGRTPG